MPGEAALGGHVSPFLDRFLQDCDPWVVVQFFGVDPYLDNE